MMEPGLLVVPTMTASGFELTFGVCHVGHFLLTQLLVDTLKASAPARVVVVSSKMHYRCKNIDFDALRKPTRSAAAMTEYGVAKLANVLFVKELAQRLEGSGVTAYALHPGVVATDVWRSVPWPFDKIIKRFMISSEEGAATSLYCATSDEVSNQSGLYYDECKPKTPSSLALDADLAKKLWAESEQWVA